LLPFFSISAATILYGQEHPTRHCIADICQFITGGLDVLEEVLKQRYDVMFATGSTALGRMVAQAAVQHLTPVVLELGGKSPCYITKCTDLEVWPENEITSIALYSWLDG
jgi:acyl-CoA reductase-like NAD-dependent aldehyde dehydrogenase